MITSTSASLSACVNSPLSSENTAACTRTGLSAGWPDTTSRRSAVLCSVNSSAPSWGKLIVDFSVVVIVILWCTLTAQYKVHTKLMSMHFTSSTRATVYNSRSSAYCSRTDNVQKTNLCSTVQWTSVYRKTHNVEVHSVEYCRSLLVSPYLKKGICNYSCLHF